MQVEEPALPLRGVLSLVLEPLFKYNPFFSLYYNPFSSPPEPQVVSKPYLNFLHQVSLVLDVIPRRRVRLLIGDEVGLGKTVEAIRLIKYLAMVGEASKILIIAPRALIRQWLYYELWDLLHAPGVLRVLGKKTVEAVKRELEEGGKPLIIVAPLDLAKRGTADKHAYGRYKPYIEVLSSVDWDLVVLDEAHQVGFTGPKPSLRVKRLSPILKRAKHLILLSATPSRGTHKDMILRMSLLIPDADTALRELTENPEKRKRLYEDAAGLLVYRRTKEHVNLAEGREVFTKLNSFMALVKLGEAAQLYERLGKFLGRLLGLLGSNANTLLKLVLLKRALSSPYAFLKTFMKVVESRSTPEPELKRLRVSDRLLEENPDALVEKVLYSTIRFVPSELRDEATLLLSEFQKLYEAGDPSFRALAYLLYYSATGRGEAPSELRGDYIVFSEYSDTVDYLFSKFTEFLKSVGFTERSDLLDKLLRGVSEKLSQRAPYARLKRLESVRNSFKVLEGQGKFFVVGKVSSKNRELVYALPALGEAAGEVLGAGVVKVLFSTDVASEGLNLQEFNVVVNYDATWSPVRREQRIGRVYRLRQTRDCSVVDFVRYTTVELAFYEKLVLKLLNMLEQKVATRPIESLLELYLEKEGSGGRERLVVSEKSIGAALLHVFEGYYARSLPIEPLLEEAYKMLLEKLRTYKDLAESLTPSYEEVRRLQKYVWHFTGCSSHEEFQRVVLRLVEVFLGRRYTEPSRAIRELYKALMGQKPASDHVVIVNESGLEEGYIAVVDFKLGGTTRFSTPVAVLRRGGNVEVLVGLQVLDWLAQKQSEGRLNVLKADWVGSKPPRILEDEVSKLAKKLDLLLYERLWKKRDRLVELTKTRLVDLERLEAEVESPFIHVVGVGGVEEYGVDWQSLPPEKREWMERVSVEHVASLFRERGCRVLEINIGKAKPYDVLVECPGPGGPERLEVEVKSHLEKVFVAGLTDWETKEAEKNPANYIVCNVAGLKEPDKSSWVTVCGRYADLPKRLVVQVKEERRAIIFFGGRQDV
jgi:superfamily II DNA or RNA helicase